MTEKKGGGTTAVMAIVLAGLFIFASASHAEVEWSGFVEEALGIRTYDVNPDSAPTLGSDFTLQETRVQLRGDAYGDVAESHFRLDLVADGLKSDSFDLDQVDSSLREAYVKFSTFGEHIDFQIGRQPTTWGTGDLLFINDLFAKDYTSFFLGREVSYLKAPADVVRMKIFGLPWDVDLVYGPSFTPDKIPMNDRFVGGVAPAAVHEPAPEFENGELALRLRRSFGSTSAALYAYRGHWKTPQELTVVSIDSRMSIVGVSYPRLNAFGGSLRGNVGPLGIGWCELGYYDTRTNHGRSYGMLRLVPASEWRALIGLERTQADLTLAGQFYVEHQVDQGTFRRPANWTEFWQSVDSILEEKTRTIVTLRADQRMRYETVTASAFLFVSPSDEDAYLRLGLSQKISDDLSASVGGNIFFGDSGTLFGAQDQNDNVWARVRFSF